VDFRTPKKFLPQELVTKLEKSAYIFMNRIMNIIITDEENK
jgi:hypothetical protein